MTATISELNLANALDGTEEYEVVQDGVSKRATADQIRTLISAIINEGNVTSIQAGLAADRPDAGTQNRYYISTDAKKIERDTGAAWEVLAQAPSTIGAGDLGFDPATQAELNAHTGNTSNPHGVTKGQVGLGNVLNKAQLAKDGSEAATGNLPMGGFKITGLADPAAAGDAVTQRILGSSAAGEGAALIRYENNLTAQQAFPAIPVDNVKALVDATHLQIDGLQAQLRAFYSNTDTGGGQFYWDADRDKSDANGGTIIDPDNVGTLSDTSLGTYLSQQGTGSGTGCWVLLTKASIANFGIGNKTVTSDVTLPAVDLVYERGITLTVRSEAVVDLSACSLDTPSDAEWIDAGGDYVQLFRNIVGQTESDFDGAGSNGSFTGGSGYSSSDTITLSDSSTLTVNAVSGGAITEFTLDGQSTASESSISGDTVTQDSTSGSGTGFDLTYGDNNEGTYYEFRDFDSSNGIDGGTVKLPIGQYSYANWFMLGATQTTGSSDVADAWNTLAHCFREQITVSDPTTWFFPGLVGIHTAAMSMDMTDLNDTTIRSLPIDLRGRILYSPAAGETAWPLIDLTHARNYEFQGVLEIEADPDNTPDYGIMLSRRSQSGTSHSNRHELSAFETRGNFNKGSKVLRRAEINSARKIIVQNNKSDSDFALGLVTEEDGFGASRWQILKPDSTSYNAGEAWDSITVIYGGDDTYTNNVPDRSAILVSGANYATFDVPYVASSTAGLLVRATADNSVTNLRVRGFNGHRAGGNNPTATVVLDVRDGVAATINNSEIEIARSDATTDDLRIVGQGGVLNSTIKVIGQNGIKCLDGTRFENATLIARGGPVDLSGASSIQGGAIYVDDPSVTVSLPNDANTPIYYLDNEDAEPLHNANQKILWFTGSLSADSTVNLTGPSSAIDYYPQLRKGSVTGVMAELDTDITGGSITQIRVLERDNTGSGSTLANFTPSFTNHRYTNARRKYQSSYGESAGIGCQVTTDASFAGPSNIVVGVQIEGE